jgi:hypothetical protein
MVRHALKSALRYLLRQVLVRLIAPPVRRRLLQFEAATLDPQAVQEALLRDILAHQAGTAYGRDHLFDAIRTVADYRRQVSVAGYEGIEPYIDRVRKGETNALLADPHVHMFALTSGTTATRKFIPVTQQYLDDYKRSWNIWGLSVFRDHKELMLRPILQMAGDHDEFRTETGVPCGAVTGLTATMQKRIVRFMYCVPPGVGRIKDPRAKYYLVMRQALPRSVAMVVAANPSTVINLARAGDAEKEALIRDVHDGTLRADLDFPADIRAAVSAKLRPDRRRAKALEEVVRRTGHLYPKDVWSEAPFLLGNWMGGSMGAYLRHYPRYFGESWVRDVGLIASEGRMTIPFADGTPAGVLDITSHYFEFIPEAEADSSQPTVLGAHELVEGGRYFILLTTAYGLYRYHIHDLVRVSGFFNKTPLLEFLSKGSLFANITGEKLSEYHVTGAMAGVLAQMDATLSTYSLAPYWPENEDELPGYALYVEEGELAGGMGEELARRLDEALCRVNIEYESKRSSGRLAALRLERVRPGFWASWDRERLRRTGGSLEQYKHPCLIGDHGFYEEVRKAGALAGSS